MNSDEPITNPWVTTRIGDGPEILTAIQQVEADELARLAAGKDVLEIGSAMGYSAIVMALAGGRVTGIDSHLGDNWLGDTLGIMQSNMAAHGVDVEIIAEMDTAALPRLCEEGRRFDLVFVDAGGGYDEVKFDVEWALKLLKPGGSIAVHDYGHVGYTDKKKVCDELFPDGPTKLVYSLFVKTP